MKSIRLLAPAKINLCLSVLARRTDGYHDVEMLMQAVGLYDEVTVSLGGSGIVLRCDSPAVPADERNIAWRAADVMRKTVGTDHGVSIEIAKSIPVAAGLGGGSSDAAAVLVACNRLFQAGLNRERLAEIGTGLGMDVPFFLYGPTALARGRGEVLTPLPPPPNFWILLVNPGFETSTAWVYKNLNLGLTKKVDCNTIARLSVAQIARSLHNDLETVTAAAHPVIIEIEQELLRLGALGVRMSGSGPTVFGVFETEGDCRHAGLQLNRTTGWRIVPAATLTSSPFGD